MIPRALVEAVGTLPRSWFAVIDGAHFGDLPAELRGWQLTSVPLYLEGSGDAGVRSGPHLVVIKGLVQAEIAIRLVAGKPAIMFWSWPGTLSTLRRHLRGINLCEIPGKPASALAWETVMFRYWDPAVLAATLPVLTPEQQSRFLGLSAAVAYDPPDHDHPVIAARPANLPAQPRGMLRFEAQQIAGITARREAASQRRIAKYLRETAPEQTARLNDEALAGFVAHYQQDARTLGIVAERDIGRWAYLAMMTRGKFTADPGVRQVFMAGGPAPGVKLDYLMGERADV